MPVHEPRRAQPPTADDIEFDDESAFYMASARVEEHALELMRHGHGSVRIECVTENKSVRCITIMAGKSYRLRIPARSPVGRAPSYFGAQGRHRLPAAISAPVLQRVADAIEQSLIEIVSHGHGEIVVQCEEGSHGSRTVTVRTGTSQRFSIPAAELTV